MGPELILVGWVASPVIGWLANLLLNKFLEPGTKKMLDGLKNDLCKAATVAELDTTGIGSKNLEDWIWRFRDALYDAEDAIDGFAYRSLKAKQPTAGGRKKTRVLQEKLHQIMRRANLFKETRNCFDYLKDRKKLKKVIKRLEKLSNDIPGIHSAVKQEQEKVEKIPGWRVTMSESTTSGASSITTPDVTLATRVLLPPLTESASRNRNFSVVPIVGAVGVGKTELARLAYKMASEKKDNTDGQGESFKVAWVHVFEKFNFKKIMIKIIEKVADERPPDLHRLENEDVIRTILTEELKDKKFLIVLDDVWRVPDDPWKQFLTSFNSGKRGSKIIVTTRLEETAKTVGTEDHIKLDVLEDKNEYWALFKEYAFGDQTPVNCPELEPIGMQIAEKYGGSPLAASKVGSKLKSKLETDHWNKILSKKLGEMEREEGSLESVLALSYQDLPEHLQRCYLSCALFPKNYGFGKEQLLQIWMALGFVLLDNGDVEDVARRSFFLNSKRSREGHSQKFTFHAVLHELADWICDGEFFRLEDNQQVEIPAKARHLYVSADNLVSISGNLAKAEKKRLRSLVIGGTLSSDSKAFMKSLKKVLKGTKRLRLLMLSALPGDLPEEISELKHLRYLEFPCREVKKLPKSFGMLYHLQCVYLNNGEDSINKPLTFRKGTTQPEKIYFIENEMKKVSFQINYYGRSRPSTPPQDEMTQRLLDEEDEYSVSNNLQRRTRRRLMIDNVDY